MWTHLRWLDRQAVSLPFLFLTLAVALALLGCGTGGEDEAPTTTASGAPAVGATLADFALTDQRGEPFGMAELQGRVWVASFFATGCETPCRGVTAGLLRVQNTLFNHPRAEEIRLVSVAIDPVSDTVSAVAAYAQNTAKAYDDRWRFLAGGGDPAVASLAESLGLELGDPADEPLAGVERVALVDKEGRARGLYDLAAEGGVDQLLGDLEKVLAEPSTVTATPGPELPRVPFPADSHNPDWLGPRGEAQRAAAGEIGVFHDFGLTDQLAASGIEFVHRVVDDAGLVYKGVHYDHGNGVAIADVDGDGLHDLYFTTQMGSNQLWRNLGDGRFEDITPRAGVGLGDRVSVTASFGDLDNDGDPDLFVTTVNDGNVLFVNDGSGRFDDRSTAAGVDHVGHSSGSVFFDYDRDGLLDLFVTNIGQYTGDERGRGDYDVGFEDAFAGHLHPDRFETSILYHNLGEGRFADVTEAMGLSDVSWSGDASPLDLNEDGFVDLYLLDMQGDDDYYENRGGERFEKRSREVFPATPWGSMGIKVFDVDNDGRMDIFLSDMHSDMSEQIGPEREKLKSRMQWSQEALGDSGPSVFGNALFMNRGDGRFEEASDAMGAENYWPWGLSTGDLNADGWQDVLLTSSMNYPWRYGPNTLLLNDEGKIFRDAEFILGIEPRYLDGRTVTPWFELDCAGDLTRHPLFPEICRGQSGRVLVEGALGTRGSVIFDLDGDGDLDIVTAEFNAAPQVLISDLSAKTTVNALEIELVGSRSNRDGLGARVTVSAGGRQLVQVHDGKSGYLSQSSQPLYFGLGDATEVEEITVLWPSGQEQTVEGPLPASGRRRIEEPE